MRISSLNNISKTFPALSFSDTSSKFAFRAFFTSSKKAYPASLVAIFEINPLISSPTIFLTVLTISSSAFSFTIPSFFVPTFSANFAISLVIAIHSFCAIVMASSISVSGISFPPASIITIALSVEETTRSSSDFKRSSVVGLTNNFPSTFPILTTPIGPFQGMDAIVKTADAAIAAVISVEFSISTERRVIISCTSFPEYSFGKSGRIERSISLPVNISSSEGLPSRLTQRLPLILPPA